MTTPEMLGARRQRRRRIELVEQAVELGEGGGLRHPPATLRARRVAGEIPADVLAEVRDTVQLVTLELDEQPDVPAHDRHDLAERRLLRYGPAGEGGGQVAEQPRPAEAAAADDRSVAPRLGHHPYGVRRRPHVAV